MGVGGYFVQLVGQISLPKLIFKIEMSDFRILSQTCVHHYCKVLKLAYNVCYLCK